MATTTWGEKPVIKEDSFHPRRKKTPSFSSSLLDAICHSIDESHHNKEDKLQNAKIPLGAAATQEITSRRREITVEKWMEYNARSAISHGYFNSDSSSSADSSLFSSSETELRFTPKLHFPNRSRGEMLCEVETSTPKHEGRLFMRTKSKALKIYGDLKKVKQPISPGGKITNFLNSFFSNSRSLKKNQGMEDLSASGMKSRSVKDSVSWSMTSRSCLNKPAASSTNKSKRSVRFCPVSVIVDEDCQPCGHKNIYDDHDYDSSLRAMPKVSSQYIKKNMDSFRDYGVKHSYEFQHDFRGSYEHDSNDYDDDDGDSCTSSDLFELDNIGIDSNGGEELPVYGTTNLKMNQAIATGMVV